MQELYCIPTQDGMEKGWIQGLEGWGAVPPPLIPVPLKV